MNQETVNRLIYEYAYGLISKDDYLVLLNIFHDDNYSDMVKIACDILWSQTDEDDVQQNFHSDAELDQLYSKLTSDPMFNERKGLTLSRYFYKWVAAAIVILLGVGTYLYIKQTTFNVTNDAVNILSNQKIVPGGNKAILTLADGSEVILDTADDGEISKQSGVTVIKLNDGQLAYQGGDNGGEVTYNTIHTPKGGQYQLRLADGTNVWLNAASSLKFPTRFTTDRREVELTGEGYFEVAHDQRKPFFVRAQEMDVQVLGTSFNINSYSDEQAIKTTLLKGKVQVNIGNSKEIMQPGQQFAFNKTNKKIQLTDNSNTDQVVAWKNGYFSFKGADIQEVLRQVARWYNIEVIYGENIPKRRFAGEFSRESELHDVLKILEESNVKFKLEGKILHVQP